MVAGALYYTGQLNTLFTSTVSTDPSLTPWQEYLAEANAFAKALLSKISQCDHFAAENIAMGLNFEADFDTAKNNYYLAGGQTGIMNSILLSLPCLGIVCSDLFDVSDGTSTSSSTTSYLVTAKELCKSTLNSNLPVTLSSSTNGYIVAEQYDVGWVENVIPEKQVYQRCQMNIDIGPSQRKEELPFSRHLQILWKIQLPSPKEKGCPNRWRLPHQEEKILLVREADQKNQNRNRQMQIPQTRPEKGEERIQNRNPSHQEGEGMSVLLRVL